MTDKYPPPFNKQKKDIYTTRSQHRLHQFRDLSWLKNL